MSDTPAPEGKPDLEQWAGALVIIALAVANQRLNAGDESRRKAVFPNPSDRVIRDEGTARSLAKLSGGGRLDWARQVGDAVRASERRRQNELRSMQQAARRALDEWWKEHQAEAATAALEDYAALFEEFLEKAEKAQTGEAVEWRGVRLSLPVLSVLLETFALIIAILGYVQAIHSQPLTQEQVAPLIDDATEQIVEAIEDNKPMPSIVIAPQLKIVVKDGKLHPEQDGE